MSAPDPMLLKAAILRVLLANDTKWGLTADAVVNLIRGEGFDEPTSTVRDALDLLLDWRFVRLASRPLDRNARAFAITADGRGLI